VTWQILAITYDVSDDKRRLRIARGLRDRGMRVLRSSFECEVADNERERLLKWLQASIDPRTDGVRIYPLCSICARRIVVFGIGPPPEEVRPPELIIL
jgi:CRISPR-associated protein Cas2